MHPPPQLSEDLKTTEKTDGQLPSPSCLLITTLDQEFVVHDMDDTAVKRIGPVLGRSLVSADWVAGAARMLADWAPYGCQLDSVSEDGIASKIFCQLFPFYDPEVKAGHGYIARSDSGLGGGYAPNRVLWTMQECPVIPDEVQIATMIRFLIKRIVDAAILRIERSRDGMEQCPNVCAVINQAELLFSFEDALLHCQDPLVDLLDKFVQWVKIIEGCLWNCHQIEMLESCNRDDLFGRCDSGQSLFLDTNTILEGRVSGGPVGEEVPKLEGSALEREYFAAPSEVMGSVYSDTYQKMHINFRRSGSTERSNNLDMSILADMSNSLDIFFTQLREVAVIPHIVGLLRTVRSASAAIMVEEFINYCQTKHTNPIVRELMRTAQDFVRSHKLENAIEALDEVRFAC